MQCVRYILGTTDKKATWLTIVCKYVFSACTSTVSEEAQTLIWTLTKQSHRHQAITSPSLTLSYISGMRFFKVKTDNVLLQLYKQLHLPHCLSTDQNLDRVRLLQCHHNAHLSILPGVNLPLCSLWNSFISSLFFTWPCQFQPLRTFNYVSDFIGAAFVTACLPGLSSTKEHISPLKCHCMTWHQKKWQSQWGLPVKKK